MRLSDGQPKPMLRALSLGTRCGSVLLSRLPKRERWSWTCKRLADGKMPRCPPIMQRRKLAERGAIARFKYGKH